MIIDYSTIKLIIWDLDETFWHGILSEHSVVIDESNEKLVRDMADAGVISSICSKNDSGDVQRIMEQRGIWNLFVFNSINLSPKGSRVQQIIASMNLRAPNVLFIDDNETNLGEVRATCSGILTSNVEILPSLKQYFSSVEKKDLSHKRLKQYKVLERKQNFRARTGSNEEFLRECNIHVEIKHDSEKYLDRIAELIQRSNQLNFTKNRSTQNELNSLIKDPTVQTGYVTAVDRFGDYGIVGFYALQNNNLLHFVFSCRTLNMGVEQYVYHELGRPNLEIIGEVSSSLDTEKPDWINQSPNSVLSEQRSELRGSKIVVKGPCDMQQIFAFIKDTKLIKKEFVNVNSYGVLIEQGCHTTHIVESQTLKNDVKQRLIKSLPFGDRAMFRTSIFDDDIGYVVLSMFTDPNLGLYREKESGAIVAFGEHTNDLTDESQWQDFIDNTIYTANCKFSLQQLQTIKQNYEFIGRIKPEESVENLEFIFQHAAPQAKILLCLGSEIPYEKNIQPAYEDRHLYHQKLNHLIREWAAEKNNVFLLDTNDLIEGQQDFTNNINHFTKQIYYKLSEQIISIVNNNNPNNALLSLATKEEQKRSVILRKVKKIPSVIVRHFHSFR